MKMIVSGTSLLLGAAIVSTNVAAQEQTRAQPAVLEEIVVQATRTSTRAQDTATALSVYTGEELADKGINDIGDLAKNDPSLRISGASTTFITVRGITSTDTTEVGDPAVPVAFDEFYTNRPLTQYAGLYDVTRVEVLRGPQGTLFGRNAVGGIINIYNARPKGDFEAASSIEVGNYNALNLTGMLNLPVSETVWFRAAANVITHDGYRRLVPVNLRGDDADSKSVRGQLAFHPNDSFSANLLFQATRVGGVGPVQRQIRFTYFQANGIGTGSPVCVLTGCEPDHVQPAGALQDPEKIQSILGNTLDIRDYTARLRLEYRFDNGMSLAYLGGYDSLDWFTRVEISRRDGTLSGRTPGGLTGPDWFQQHQSPKTTNHELRLVSNQASVLSWQAGLFYFKEDNELLSERIDKPRTTLENHWLKFNYPDVGAVSKAAYVHSIYSLNDSFKLSAGVRYTKDEKSRFGAVVIFNNPLAIVVPAGTTSSSQSTWHVGADWKVNPVTLLYAKADKGYKAGGYGNTTEYGPEKLIAYELGLKTTLDQRVQFNTALFYNDYKDQQVAQLGANIAAGTVVRNAGKSEIYGLEADVTALLGETSRFGLHGTFQKGEYKEFLIPNAPGTCPFNAIPHTTPSCNQQLAGNDTIQTPNVSLSASFDHTFLMNAGSTWTPSVSARYSSKAYFSPFNFASSLIAAHTVIDLEAKFLPADGNWDANLYVRNVADKIFLTDFAEQQVSGIETYNFGYSAPRTFGVRFNYRWK